MKSIGYSFIAQDGGTSMLPRVPSAPYQRLKADWREILGRAIAASGKKKRRVSLDAGLSHSIVSEWLRENNPKSPSFDAIAKVAKVVNLSLDALVEHDETKALVLDGGGIYPSTLTTAPVVGHVQAGNWQEPGMLETVEEQQVPYSPDARYVGLQQFAWKVVGSSLNRIAPDGSFIITVRFIDLGRDPREGEPVVCERRRHGLHEYTVKRVRKAPGGGFMLVPDSDDPRFQEPIWLSATEENGTEVVATHLVIGVYRTVL